MNLKLRWTSLAALWSLRRAGLLNGLTLLILLATGATGANPPRWQEPYVIKNIAINTADADMGWTVPIGQTLYFTVQHLGVARADEELWRSDGTIAGTLRLEAFDESYMSDLHAAGGKLFFMANVPGISGGIWVSDGTPGNAHPIGDENTPPPDASADHLTAAGDYAYFQAVGDDGYVQLWRTDGTVDGTFRLTGPDYPIDLILGMDYTADLNHRLYFTSYTADGRLMLGQSDGTPDGTRHFAGLGTEPPASLYVSQPPLFAWNGQLILLTRAALWRSDGTAAGTAPYFGFGNLWPHAYAVGATNIYLLVETTGGGEEIWKTNGTTTGTVRVAALPSLHTLLGVVGDRLFFVASDPAHGMEVWTSDGTSAGTKLLKDIDPGPNDSLPSNAVVAGDQIFFVAGDGHPLGWRALWHSDGTAAGTAKVSLGLSPAVNTYALPVTPLGDRLLFLANDDVHGREPWLTTGNGAEATFLVDLNPLDELGSMPTHFRYVNDVLYFTTAAGLWRSDGSEGGTSLLWANRYLQQTLASEPLGDDGRLLYFLADDYPTNKTQLWRTDGTAAGTTMLRPLTDMYRDRPASAMSGSDGRLFFARANGVGAKELWRSDGTSAGTVYIATPNNTLDQSSAIALMTPAGTGAFFVATDGSHGVELWHTDGTTAGTAMVRDIYGGAAGSEPQQLALLGSQLYFTADDGSHGRELWRSDGTSDGTVMVKDVLPGAAPSEIGDLTPFHSALYFTAKDGTHGAELWKSDGTTAGTNLLKDLNPTLNIRPLELTAGTDWLYFVGFDEQEGYQPWKTDGTAQRTSRIAVIEYNEFHWPRDLATVGNTLYFSADFGTLYQSDGTAAGTVSHDDAFPAFGGYEHSWLTPAPGRLFFTAANLFSGQEPFAQVIELTHHTPSQLRLRAGEVAQYRFQLNRPPTAPLQVSFASGDAGLQIAPASITLTPQNWRAPRVIEVRAPHDVAGIVQATITETFASADLHLDGATSQMPVGFGWHVVYAPLTVR